MTRYLLIKSKTIYIQNTRTHIHSAYCPRSTLNLVIEHKASFSETGHYLYLPETIIPTPPFITHHHPDDSISSPYDALTFSPFLDTTGKCLAMVFWPLGDFPATLVVVIQDENGFLNDLYRYNPADSRSTVRDWAR